MNILVLCSRNQWRSPTAEALWSRHAGLTVRSAGTSDKARRRVKRADLDWADLIFVMEASHLRLLRARFRPELQGKQVINLDIPDEFRYMDPELVHTLELAMEPYLP